MLWGSIEIGFFFLDRSSEHWGPPTTNDHERDVSHCVKAADVIFRNKYGFITEPGPEKFPQWKSSTGHIKEIKRDRAARSATFDLVYQITMSINTEAMAKRWQTSRSIPDFDQSIQNN
ncbi:Hypothetical protein PHPALM_3083 [Phytophthora palmivora]|uniref:Uncharacterized protein n=1 Tax=Phytophthora palmivora TaxID=4796 RepID=A0A2P4YNE0_9STRA|nr:Hypothetical protein PHPALM_3083 [Phytophthora palmivora]